MKIDKPTVGAFRVARGGMAVITSITDRDWMSILDSSRVFLACAQVMLLRDALIDDVGDLADDIPAGSNPGAVITCAIALLDDAYDCIGIALAIAAFYNQDADVSAELGRASGFIINFGVFWNLLRTCSETVAARQLH